MHFECQIHQNIGVHVSGRQDFESAWYCNHCNISLTEKQISATGNQSYCRRQLLEKLRAYYQWWHPPSPRVLIVTCKKNHVTSNLIRLYTLTLAESTFARTFHNICLHHSSLSFHEEQQVFRYSLHDTTSRLFSGNIGQIFWHPSPFTEN